MNLLKLFTIFMKLGAMTFGGGYAMLPLLQKEIVEKHELATEDELTEYYAVGQCTPGIISVNTATFIGYKYAKIKGAIVATLGLIFIPFLLILLLANIINMISDLTIVKNAFIGIRICVGALILSSIINLSKTGIKDRFTMLLYILMLLLAFISISPVVIVIIAGILGLLGGHRDDNI